MNEVRETVAALLRSPGARAAGCWRIEGERLIQAAFLASDDLPEEVARRFAEATLEVPLSRTGLGIVNAALTGEPVVSRVEDLPPQAGSGYWLRAFDAERSVAVPIRDERGNVFAVMSVALAHGPLDDRAVVEYVRTSAALSRLDSPPAAHDNKG